MMSKVKFTILYKVINIIRNNYFGYNYYYNIKKHECVTKIFKTMILVVKQVQVPFLNFANFRCCFSNPTGQYLNVVLREGEGQWCIMIGWSLWRYGAIRVCRSEQSRVACFPGVPLHRLLFLVTADRPLPPRSPNCSKIHLDGTTSSYLRNRSWQPEPTVAEGSYLWSYISVERAAVSIQIIFLRSQRTFKNSVSFAERIITQRRLLPSRDRTRSLFRQSWERNSFGLKCVVIHSVSIRL